MGRGVIKSRFGLPYSGKLWRALNLAKRPQDGIGEFKIWRFECSASYARMRKRSLAGLNLAISRKLAKWSN